MGSLRERRLHNVPEELDWWYYIREVQDKGTGGEGSHILLPELEALDREWSQDEWESGNCRGRKH